MYNRHSGTEYHLSYQQTAIMQQGSTQPWWMYIESKVHHNLTAHSLRDSTSAIIPISVYMHIHIHTYTCHSELGPGTE